MTGEIILPLHRSKGNGLIQVELGHFQIAAILVEVPRQLLRQIQVGQPALVMRIAILRDNVENRIPNQDSLGILSAANSAPGRSGFRHGWPPGGG